MPSGFIIWAIQDQASGQIIPHAFGTLDAALTYIQQNLFLGEAPTLAGSETSYNTTNADRPILNVVSVDVLM